MELIKLFVLMLALFIATAIQGQEAHPQEDTKIFKPSSSSFIPLLLQTHKGKMRLGIQDDYKIAADGTYKNSKETEYRALEKKTSHQLASAHAFKALLKLRFQEDILGLMDKEFFTEQTSQMYAEEKKSHAAQDFVLRLANALGTQELKKQLFCNEKSQDCNGEFKENGYYDLPRHIRYWGGKSPSEFQRLRAYTTFVNEDLPTLKTWASELYKENIIDAYYVAKISLGTYDFKHRGYWLDMGELSHNGFLAQWYNLQPKNATEQKLKNPNAGRLLYALPPEKAETFSEKHKELFLVLDITATIKGIESYRNDRLKIYKTLNSPMITLYTDDSLTLEIGEIDTNTVQNGLQ